MGGEAEKWVLMVTARTPTNIAVIKYWGKRDETLILPINDSISVTLDPSHLCTTTTVSVSPSFDQDRMWLNGKEISLQGGRFQSCLREIRARAQDVEDKKKGIKINKEDWQKLNLHIASYNNFPTAAGLASSAAGLACLVFSLAKLMNLKEDNSQLSAIARQGSGSACRSLYGGFVKWCMGKEENGSDSLAVQLADEKHWDELVIIIAVVSARQKETSSTSGMRDTVETSALIEHRAKEVVPKRITEMEGAIQNRDFATFARLACTDSNQFHAVCLDTYPPIFYMNDTSHRIISCVEKWNRAEETPQVAYTFDAGPNAVMIARNRKTAALLLQRLLYNFPPQSNTDRVFRLWISLHSRFCRRERTMTMFHFFNCAILTFGPHAVYYSATPLSEYDTLGTSVKTAVVYLGTALVKLVCLATFLKVSESDSFDPSQELLKALIGFIDVAGLYFALTQLTHRNISQNHKFQAVGLGWAFADSVLHRLAPLWVGARGLEFTWDYILQGLEANANLMLSLSLAALGSLMWLRKNKPKTLIPIIYACAGIVATMPSITSYLRWGLKWHLPEVVGFQVLTSLTMALISWQLFSACQRPSSSA